MPLILSSERTRDILAGKFTVSHLYDRSGQTFVPNVRVFIRSIVPERTYAGFTEFLNPYL